MKWTCDTCAKTRSDRHNYPCRRCTGYAREAA